MAERFDVFVSSTSRDLTSYRDAIEKVILRLGLHPILMEAFNPSESNALQLCYNQLQEAEVFVGVYAHRYGYAPGTDVTYVLPDGTMRAGDGETSITHHEYLWAIERDMPILLFVISDTDAKGEPLAWPVAHIEDEPGKTRLKEFKELIMGRHVVGFFHSPDDLAGRVATALAELKSQFAFTDVKVSAALPRRRDHLPQSLPEHYIPRNDVLADLRMAIIGNSENRSLPSRRMLALHGMGGIGKSVVARALCDDSAVRAVFHDGILWTTLGKNPNLTLKLREWVKALGGTIGEHEPTIDSLKAVLVDLLAERACLLVVDDVWQKKHGEAFRIGGENCHLLLTTRDAEVARSLGASIHPIAGMSRAESIDLLKAWAGDNLSDSDESVLTTIITRLGRLPVAIQLAGAQLQSKLPDKWLKRFDARKLEEKRGDPDDPHSSLERCFGMSLSELKDVERKLYAALAIFKEDEPIREVAIARLWSSLGTIDEEDAEELLDDLAARALLQVVGDEYPRAAALHDLLRDFMAAELEDPKAAHVALLDAYRETQQGDGWHATPDDGYLWNHIAYHLFEAGLHAELNDTFTDLRFLAKRLLQDGIRALENDLLSLQQVTSNDAYYQIQAFVSSHNRRLTEISDPERLIQVFYNYLRFAPAFSNDLARWREWLPAARLEALQPLPTNSKSVFRMTVAEYVNNQGQTRRDAVLSATINRKVALYTTSRGSVVLRDFIADKTLKVFNGFNSYVNDCDMREAYQFAVACGFLENKIVVWDLETSEIVYQFPHEDVCSCKLLPHSNKLVTTAFSGTIKLWDLNTGLEIYTIIDVPEILDCCVSPDEAFFFTTSTDNQYVKMWKAATGELLHTFEHDSWVTCCALSADGSELAVGCDDGSIHLWQVNTGAQQWSQTLSDKAVMSCAVIPNMQLIAAVSLDSQFMVVSKQDGGIRFNHDEANVRFTSCTADESGKFVATAAYDGKLVVWQAAKLLEDASSLVAIQWYRGASVHPQHSIIALGATSKPYQISLWNFDSGDYEHKLKELPTRINRCQFSRDGSYLAVSSDDGYLRMYDTLQYTLLWERQAHSNVAVEIVFDSTGQHLFSWGKDLKVRVWTVSNGELVTEFFTNFGIKHIALSSDDQFLAIALAWVKLANRAGESGVYIWHPSTNTIYATILAGDREIEASTFTFNNRRILTVNREGVVEEWDIETGSCIRRLGQHTSQAWDCSTDPTGQFVITSGPDDIMLWNLRTGEQILQFDAMDTLMSVDVDWERQLVAVGGARGLHLFRLNLGV